MKVTYEQAYDVIQTVAKIKAKKGYDQLEAALDAVDYSGLNARELSWLAIMCVEEARELGSLNEPAPTLLSLATFLLTSAHPPTVDEINANRLSLGIPPMK